jgi:hypothetical protein
LQSTIAPVISPFDDHQIAQMRLDYQTARGSRIPK